MHGRLCAIAKQSMRAPVGMPDVIEGSWNCTDVYDAHMWHERTLRLRVRHSVRCNRTGFLPFRSRGVQFDLRSLHLQQRIPAFCERRLRSALRVSNKQRDEYNPFSARM